MKADLKSLPPPDFNMSMFGSTQYEGGIWVYPTRGKCSVSNPTVYDFNDIYLYFQFTDDTKYDPYMESSYILHIMGKAKYDNSFDINGQTTLYYSDTEGSHNYGKEHNIAWNSVSISGHWSAIVLKSWNTYMTANEEDFCGVIMYWGTAGWRDVYQVGIYWALDKFASDYAVHSTQRASVRFYRAELST